MAVPTINGEECVGCGACVEACPQDVLAMVDEKAAVSDADSCIECGICAEECAVQAIAV